MNTSYIGIQKNCLFMLDSGTNFIESLLLNSKKIIKLWGKRKNEIKFQQKAYHKFVLNRDKIFNK